MQRPPFLLEYADKLALLLIPYLFILSSLYYAGYWGKLGIDVYNYFQVSDLIKGAGYPLQFTLAIVALNVLLVSAFAYVAVQIFKRIKSAEAFMGFVFVMLVPFLALLYWTADPILSLLFGKVPHGWPTILLPIVNLPFYVVGAIFILGTWATNSIVTPLFRDQIMEITDKDGVFSVKPTARSARYLLMYSSLFALFVTPCYSVAVGYYNAKQIRSGKSFDYIEQSSYQQDSALAAYPYLKYLGRIGDYHFLLSPDNSRRIIVEKERFATLTLLSSQVTAPMQQPKKKPHISTPF